MNLPINIKELNTIINALSLGGDVALYQKLKLVKQLVEQELPYQEILKKDYGMDF